MAETKEDGTEEDSGNVADEDSNALDDLENSFNIAQKHGKGKGKPDSKHHV